MPVRRRPCRRQLRNGVGRNGCVRAWPWPSPARNVHSTAVPVCASSILILSLPMTAFYEPCYESGKASRWGIGMADQSMFAVGGLWREWDGTDGPEWSFTQLTINADDHPLMQRFHKPGDEKRALVIVPQNEWDDWLQASEPEYARSFLRHYPAEAMTSWECPVPSRAKKADTPPEASDGNLAFDF
ncbi:SOS response-associated peptidase family protein [Pseudoduganella aquatica]|uniref:SOS response-associated peptidase family protein n=1 Tax=Pseudoduganella aquatica TaxID=2660641 RepID=UPI002AA2A7AB|nr:SOS response-associated peptidase family protein [Pseudoduganella aquatica]